MFPGLSSYFTDRSSFGGLREMNVLHLAEDDRALVVDFDPLVGMEKAGILNPDTGLGMSRLQIMERMYDVYRLSGEQ